MIEYICLGYSGADLGQTWRRAGVDWRRPGADLGADLGSDYMPRSRPLILYNYRQH